MDYAQFLRLRESEWADFAHRLGEARQHPNRLDYDTLESLALQYRQILQDHALASSRFPGTGASRRLARLAVEGTRWLHGAREDHSMGFGHFWTRSFPLAFRATVRSLAVTTSLFLVASLFGFFLATVQTRLAVSLLGPGTIEELRQGHLWTDSLVRSVPHAVSSSAIATNNIGVAFIGWAGGALAGLGSLYVVLFNGFHLGALLGVTHHYSLAGRLLEFVAAHGQLEITLILVTAAAGLEVGRALIAAGDVPRDEALREAAKRSLRVVLGCAPWFVVLAIIESNLSPAPDLPAWIKVSIGTALETLFLLAAWNPFLPEEKA